MRREIYSHLNFEFGRPMFGGRDPKVAMLIKHIKDSMLRSACVRSQLDEMLVTGVFFFPMRKKLKQKEQIARNTQRSQKREWNLQGSVVNDSQNLCPVQ